MKKLIIVGAGGFGRELLQWVKDVNAVTPQWDILGFIDDNMEHALEGYACSHTVIGAIKDWIPGEDECFVMGIASPNAKMTLVPELKRRGARFVSIVHPSAYIAPNAKLGEGVVVYPGAFISVNTKIDDFATILPCGIGHDAHIGAFSTVSSYCDIMGHVEVGEGVYFGSHACVIPGRRIGAGAFIAVGSVVMTNVKPGVKMMGNPAKKITL